MSQNLAKIVVPFLRYTTIKTKKKSFVEISEDSHTNNERLEKTPREDQEVNPFHLNMTSSVSKRAPARLLKNRATIPALCRGRTQELHASSSRLTAGGEHSGLSASDQGEVILTSGLRTSAGPRMKINPGPHSDKG